MGRAADASPSPPLGTLLAVVAAALLALPAAGPLRPGAASWRRGSLLNVLRSVPELVWAALMVLAAGLGPFAGTLALALHTTGVLGRLFAESLENAPRGAGAVAARSRQRRGRAPSPTAALPLVTAAMASPTRSIAGR